MIYFIQPKDGGLIKIGTTGCLSQRLAQLCAEWGEGLQVLAVVAGSHAEEKALHRRFAHLRHSGEWFEPGDDLLAFVLTDACAWDGEDECFPTVTVRIHADLLKKARIVCSLIEGPLGKQRKLGDLLDELVRGPIEKQYQELIARLSQQD